MLWYFEILFLIQGHMGLEHVQCFHLSYMRMSLLLAARRGSKSVVLFRNVTFPRYMTSLPIWKLIGFYHSWSFTTCILQNSHGLLSHRFRSVNSWNPSFLILMRISGQNRMNRSMCLPVNIPRYKFKEIILGKSTVSAWHSVWSSTQVAYTCNLPI